MAEYFSRFTGDQVDRAVELIQNMTTNPGDTESPIAGSLYIGEAFPGTDPGIPTTRVCYLAKTPGTYTNFNGIEVPENKLVVLNWNMVTWSAIEINLGNEGVIGEDFITNMTVGGIDSNTHISTDRTLASIIKDMLVKLKYATIVKYPEISISSNISTSVEIGSTVAPIITVSYTDGKFKQWIDGGASSNEIAALCSQGNTVLTRDEEAYISGNSFQVNVASTIKAEKSYGASQAKPTNSDGKSTVSIPAGNCDPKTITFNPYPGCFFKTVDSDPGSVNRATFGSPDRLITGNSLSFDKNFDKHVILLAIPTNYRLTSAISKNNESQMDLFVTSSVTIADAGGVDRNYTLYKAVYGDPLDVVVTLVISKI